jgi:hypothetical protein
MTNTLAFLPIATTKIAGTGKALQRPNILAYLSCASTNIKNNKTTFPKRVTDGKHTSFFAHSHNKRPKTLAYLS